MNEVSDERLEGNWIAENGEYVEEVDSLRGIAFKNIRGY
jgi:hypothetical protein